MNFKKSVSIIIPNFNGRDLLEIYLPETIEAIASEGVDYEIIVINDGCWDDSNDFLEIHYPQIKIINNPSNMGFSYSCNRGMEIARNELLFFLNSDIKLSPIYFTKLWRYFSNPNTFGVMGKILVPDGKKIEVAARFPQMNGCKLKTDRLFYLSAASTKATPTIFLSGANALVDAKKFRVLGGFDEIYSPFYSEDADLGIRAWKLGWKSYYDHVSTCYHLGSHTTKKYCEKNQVKMVYYRNRMVLHAIHTEDTDLLFWKFQLFLMEVIPKLLIGQIWILQSYLGFRKKKEQIDLSRKFLEQLMNSHNSKKTMPDINNYFFKISKDKNPIWV